MQSGLPEYNFPLFFPFCVSKKVCHKMMYMKKNKAFWPYLVRKNTYIREYDLFKSRLAHHDECSYSI